MRRHMRRRSGALLRIRQDTLGPVTVGNKEPNSPPDLPILRTRSATGSGKIGANGSRRDARLVKSAVRQFVGGCSGGQITPYPCSGHGRLSFISVVSHLVAECRFGKLGETVRGCRDDLRRLPVGKHECGQNERKSDAGEKSSKNRGHGRSPSVCLSNRVGRGDRWS